MPIEPKIVMPNRVIILEGPDGGGKTTLAKALAYKYGYTYKHEGPLPERVDPLTYYGLKMYHALQEKTPVVFDRLFIGQDVYGPLLRNQRCYSYDEWHMFNRLVRGAAIHIVFCRPPYEVALQNWKGRKGELYQNDDVFKHVYQDFEAEENGPYFPYAGHWDYTQVPLDVAVELLYLFRSHEPYPLGVIGSPTASFLFVGETANHESLDIPFFSNHGCSPFFNDCLRQAGYEEQEIAMCNARDVDGGKNPFLYHNGFLKQFKAIIALGRLAANTVNPKRGRVYEVAHPQFQKRFMNGTHHRYISELATIRKETYALSSSEPVS